LPRTIEKPEALQLLAENREQLLGGDTGCVLCALVGRASSSPDLVHEGEHGVVLLDRFGTREGHLLVISRAHAEDTLELGWDVYRELQRLAYEARGSSRARSRQPAFSSPFWAPRPRCP
jgi:hypothetical protein